MIDAVVKCVCDDAEKGEKRNRGKGRGKEDVEIDEERECEDIE